MLELFFLIRYDEEAALIAAREGAIGTTEDSKITSMRLNDIISKWH